MLFDRKLIQGRLIRRYKRFLADIELDDGTIVTAHCANPGNMYGIINPGLDVWLSETDNLQRKLRYSWEIVRADGAFIGVNTSRPNALTLEAMQNQIIEELKGYPWLKKEVKYGQSSRLDFLLYGEKHVDCFVEVKNVHMKRQPFIAEFPDSVTTRGSKHLCEMIDIIQNGKRAVMLYIIQRDDCDYLSFAGDIDPIYAKNARQAKDYGVEFYAYSCDINLQGITIKDKIPVLF